jgi:hypothetical protein
MSVPRAGGDAMPNTRKLAAILAADVAGYSRLASVDEDSLGWTLGFSPLRPVARTARVRLRTAAGSGRSGTGKGRPGDFAVSRGVEMGVLYFTRQG